MIHLLYVTVLALLHYYLLLPGPVAIERNPFTAHVISRTDGDLYLMHRSGRRKVDRLANRVIDVLLERRLVRHVHGPSNIVSRNEQIFVILTQKRMFPGIRGAKLVPCLNLREIWFNSTRTTNDRDRAGRRYRGCSSCSVRQTVVPAPGWSPSPDRQLERFVAVANPEFNQRSCSSMTPRPILFVRFVACSILQRI